MKSCPRIEIFYMGVDLIELKELSEKQFFDDLVKKVRIELSSYRIEISTIYIKKFMSTLLKEDYRLLTLGLFNDILDQCLPEPLARAIRVDTREVIFRLTLQKISIHKEEAFLITRRDGFEDYFCGIYENIREFGDHCISFLLDKNPQNIYYLKFSESDIFGQILLIYSAPKGSEDLELEYEINSWGDEGIVLRLLKGMGVSAPGERDNDYLFRSSKRIKEDVLFFISDPIELRGDKFKEPLVEKYVRERLHIDLCSESHLPLTSYYCDYKDYRSLEDELSSAWGSDYLSFELAYRLINLNYRSFNQEIILENKSGELGSETLFDRARLFVHDRKNLKRSQSFDVIESFSEGWIKQCKKINA